MNILNRKKLNLNHYKEILFDFSKPKVYRIQALFKIMSDNSLKSVNIISKTLFEDNCPLVRHEAAFCLGELNFEKSRDNLIKALKKDKSEVVIHECLVALGIIGKKEDIPLLEKFLKSKSTIIKNSAEIGIERLKQKDFFEIKKEETRKDYEKRLISLIDKIDKKNDFIQIIFRLMTFENETSAKALFKIYNLVDCPIVKHEVAFCLGEMRVDLAKKILFEILNLEKNPVVLHETLFALGTYKNLDKEEKKKIKFFLNHKDYIVSESAKIALDRIEKLKKPYKGTEEFDYLNKNS